MPSASNFDAGAIETQALDVRLPPGGDEQVATLDDLGLALLADMHGDALDGALDPLHARTGMQHHA